MPWTFWGPVTNAANSSGGFRLSGGGWIGFESSANDFTGGLEVEGVVENGEIFGGVTVRNAGAIPTNTAFTVRNANVEVLAGSAERPLPKLTAESDVKVVAATNVVDMRIKALEKVGPGTVTLPQVVRIEGATTVTSGTVRISGEALGKPGLSWYRSSKRISDYDQPIPRGAYQGVDANGASYAYQNWPEVANWNDAYYYTGYIKVPGEEGSDVTINFISSMARVCRVDIGGQTAIKCWDNWDNLSNTENGYTRFSVGPQITVKAGWQPIYICMANYYDGTRGPQANTGRGWVADFGIGVDWQGRREAVPANYAKLQDDGTGSFLRAGAGKIFAGETVFSNGTSLAMDGTTCAAPVLVSSLKGTPTITGGMVMLTDSWTIDFADVAAGRVLTVGDNARFGVAEDVVVRFAGNKISTLPGGQPRRYPLVRTTGSGIVDSFSDVSSHGYGWRVERAAGGNGYDLVHRSGLIVIVP